MTDYYKECKMVRIRLSTNRKLEKYQDMLNKKSINHTNKGAVIDKALSLALEADYK